tara:strand:- start:587 stop:787 length:201 start_codon:yes stop_codon:yes gene_type:complete
MQLTEQKVESVFAAAVGAIGDGFITHHALQLLAATGGSVLIKDDHYPITESLDRLSVNHAEGVAHD